MKSNFVHHSPVPINQVLSDDAVLAELGQRLSRYRIDAGLTQQALAEKAGISKSTLERMEAGGASQLPNLIRVLRALDMLSMLDVAIPPPIPRPMELLRHQRKIPQRVRTRHQHQADTRAEEDQDMSAVSRWIWGDEHK
jgi:transcriptional regulator with XRE-family HTH domain